MDERTNGSLCIAQESLEKTLESTSKPFIQFCVHSDPLHFSHMPLQSLPFFSRCAQAPSVPLCAALITSHSLWVLVDPLCSPTCALEPHSSHPCMLRSSPLPFVQPQSVPPFLSALHPSHGPSTCFQIPSVPFWLLLDPLRLILSTSKHPQMLSIHIQLLSHPLHSPHCAFLEHFCCLPCTDSLHSPCCMLRCPSFPSLCIQISFVPLLSSPPYIFRSLLLSVST